MRLAVKRIITRLFLPLRQLYYWVLKWSAHRHNTKALSSLAFVEASFFPIPPDPLMMAMAAAKPRRALWYAFLTTVFSTLGGLFGYLIGFLFWEFTADFFFQYVFSQDVFERVTEQFQIYTFISLLVAALTPIPFKVFTVAGGVAAVPLWPFFLACLLGRGMRFFTVGLVLYFFGASIMEAIERYFEWVVVVFTVLLLGGFFLISVWV